MYISGSYFCAKKSIMEQYPLNEKLEWGEAEDVEWSLRTRNKINYSCNYYSEVILIKEKISSHNILSSDNKRFIINSKKLENDFNAGIENNFTISDYASWLNFRLDYAIGKLKRIVKNILIKR